MAGLKISSMKRISPLLFHVILTGWIHLPQMATLDCNMDFPSISSLPQILSSFQHTCDFCDPAACCYTITSVVWLHFPYLSSPSFLHGSLNHTISSLPSARRDSQEPEYSVMAHVGFLLHRQEDCGLHLSSKKKWVRAAFYMSMLCKELKNICARRDQLCLHCCCRTTALVILVCYWWLPSHT